MIAFSVRDSFYHSKYKWATEDVDVANNIKIETVDNRGSPRRVFKFVSKLFNVEGRLDGVDVDVKATVYSGYSEATFKSSPDEYGQLHVRGHNVNWRDQDVMNLISGVGPGEGKQKFVNDLTVLKPETVQSLTMAANRELLQENVPSLAGRDASQTRQVSSWTIENTKIYQKYPMMNAQGVKEMYQGDEMTLGQAAFDRLIRDLRSAGLDMFAKKLLVAPRFIPRTSWRNEDFAIVLRELIMNSLDANAGKIELKAVVAKEDLVLEITDNGRGFHALIDINKVEEGVTSQRNVSNNRGKGRAYCQAFVKEVFGENSSIQWLENMNDPQLPKKGVTVRIVIPAPTKNGSQTEKPDNADHAMPEGKLEKEILKLGSPRIGDTYDGKQDDLYSAQDIWDRLEGEDMKLAFLKAMDDVRPEKKILVKQYMQRGNNIDLSRWIVYVDRTGKVLGRMSTKVNQYEVYLGDLGVVPDFQGLHIGSRMFLYFCRECDRRQGSMGNFYAEGSSSGFYSTFLERMNVTGFTTKMNNDDDWTRIRIDPGAFRSVNWDKVHADIGVAGAEMKNDLQDAGMAQENDLGGIDLNSSNLNLQIKRDGQGVALPLRMQDIENIKIDGLTPEIISIQPLTTLPVLSSASARSGRL